jgi:superfamily I DNA/RNA helicase
MVCSFTRAASAELASRQPDIDPDCIGTLHAHCYRLLGHPKLAESQAGEFSLTYPHFALKSASPSALDDGSLSLPAGIEFDESRGNGDDLLAHYALLRNKMTPRALWPGSVLAFASAWEAWKADCDFLDFTDLIERALAEIPAYEDKRVALIDEAQDLTPLQLKLARQWGEKMNTFVMVGDDDQAIYGFAGASPEAFLATELPPEQEIVLGQSYRVPRLVQAAAQKWIAGVSHRKVKEYKARDCDGALLEHPGNFKNPSGLLNDAEKYLAAGKTVMFLAPCSFQVQPLVTDLRRRGWPFHNPYRRSRGDWNPLTPGKGLSTAQRLLAYLEPGIFPMDWYPDQIMAWGEMLTANAAFQRGMKGKLAELPWPDVERNPSPENWEAFWHLLGEVFKPGAYEQAQSLGLEWLREHVTADYQRRLEFPARVAETSGTDALKRKPQIIVGTIQSVKGGEADVTYLCPDISAEAYKAADRGLAVGDASARDDVIRQFYVGLTRCRETLVMARPATAFSAQAVRRMQ